MEHKKEISEKDVIFEKESILIDKSENFLIVRFVISTVVGKMDKRFT